MAILSIIDSIEIYGPILPEGWIGGDLLRLMWCQGGFSAKAQKWEEVQVLPLSLPFHPLLALAQKTAFFQKTMEVHSRR